MLFGLHFGFVLTDLQILLLMFILLLLLIVITYEMQKHFTGIQSVYQVHVPGSEMKFPTFLGLQ